MKKLLFLCIFTASIAAVWTSCSKNEEVPQNTQVNNEAKVQVIDGVLSFVDNDHFFRILSIVKKMSNEDFLKWESSIGFLSLESEFNIVQTQLANTSVIEEYENILSKNKDIVKVHEELPLQKNHFVSLNRILNRSGNVFIKNILYNYSDKGEVIIANGDFQLLEDANLVMKSDKSKGVFCFPLENENSRAACGSSQIATFTNSANDRKAVVQATTSGEAFLENNSTFNTFRVIARSSVVGLPYKKNLFGKWVRYKTTNDLSSNYEVRTFEWNFQPYVVNSTFSHAYTNYWDVIDDGTIHLDRSGVPENQVGGHALYFSKIKTIKYGTTGTNNNFAIIDCE